MTNPVDKPTPGNLIQTVSELVDAENAGGNSLIAASVFTPIIVPDTFVGSGTITVIETAQAATVLALQITGDAFPRLLLTSDGEIFFGDGTSDPVSTGTDIYFTPGRLTIGTTPLHMAFHDIIFDGTLKGPIVSTPDALHTYRLGVDNTGTVIATLVT